ncbi:MAG TPA: hypothetical protein VFO09_03240 [Methyloceanibacter sp.]|nr:hypothetical protein [Methyloceanibacter sp.]
MAMPNLVCSGILMNALSPAMRTNALSLRRLSMNPLARSVTAPDNSVPHGVGEPMSWDAPAPTTARSSRASTTRRAARFWASGSAADASPWNRARVLIMATNSKPRMARSVAPAAGRLVKPFMSMRPS